MLTQVNGDAYEDGKRKDDPPGSRERERERFALFLAARVVGRKGAGADPRLSAP